MGFVDALVNQLLDVDTAREVAIFMCGLGQGSPAPATSPPCPVLSLETGALALEEQDYAAIGITHRASSLDDTTAVRGWWPQAPTLYRPAPSHPTFHRLAQPAGHDINDGIEAVIRRRGSTRQFSSAPLSFAQLCKVLAYATQSVPADFNPTRQPPLNDLYLIVHAVSDLPAGSYRYHVAAQQLERLQAGDFRHEAGMLALGQELAADASVNIYVMCDLITILEHGGNRGYRVAQMEAGLLGGRMYLAAYAQGFGATGLTFFDDEVIDFFSPHATDKRVMFLIALGHSTARKHIQ